MYVYYQDLLIVQILLYLIFVGRFDFMDRRMRRCIGGIGNGEGHLCKRQSEKTALKFCEIMFGLVKCKYRLVNIFQILRLYILRVSEYLTAILMEYLIVLFDRIS